MACAVLVRFKVKVGRATDAIEMSKATTTQALANGAKSVRVFRTSPGGPNTNIWTSLFEFDSLHDMASWLDVTSASPTLQTMERLYAADTPVEDVQAEVLNEVDLANL
ncbi:MAG: hypothetical protein AB7G23_19885 [Vicinamibacterales bacterium]